jgi:FtsH-binding integral membrane protein
MQPNLYEQNSYPYDSSEALAQSNRVLRNTYFLLALSLIPTIIGAAIGTNMNFGFMRASPIMGMLILMGIM